MRKAKSDLSPKMKCEIADYAHQTELMQLQPAFILDPASTDPACARALKATATAAFTGQA